MHEENSFITLTYAEANIPEQGQLRYIDFQKFMRRLRKHYAPKQVRFFMCGEYGPQLERPHFHACLFGLDFEDKEYWSKMPSGEKLYRSKTLERLWPQGFSSVGAVTFESAGYVARYCMKKITGHNARYYYQRDGYDLIPEFSHMSLKPGIGRTFLEKWETDIYPRDEVILRGGISMKPPKYYDKIYSKSNEEEYEEIQYERLKAGRKNYIDNTERRLRDKEIVTEARISNLTRKIGNYEENNHGKR